MTAAAMLSKSKDRFRLPVLALKINTAHSALRAQIKTTIEHMMMVGDDLRDAKALVGHGKWLPWLKTNCPDISERTAHLYMQFAKWRAVIEAAMARYSQNVADLDRDRLLIPGTLVAGPFGVADAIAAIREAERHETAVKENRLRLAAGSKRKEHSGPEHPFAPRLYCPIGHTMLPVEAEFANHLKCCLSRIGPDATRRAEFLRQARAVLDAIENQTELPLIEG